MCFYRIPLVSRDIISIPGVLPWAFRALPKLNSSSTIKFMRLIDHDTKPRRERNTSRATLAPNELQWLQETGSLPGFMTSLSVPGTPGGFLKAHAKIKET